MGPGIKNWDPWFDRVPGRLQNHLIVTPPNRPQQFRLEPPKYCKNPSPGIKYWDNGAWQSNLGAPLPALTEAEHQATMDRFRRCEPVPVRDVWTKRSAPISDGIPIYSGPPPKRSNITIGTVEYKFTGQDTGVMSMRREVVGGSFLDAGVYRVRFIFDP